MAHTELDRQALISHKVAVKHAADLLAWLERRPEVGVLNGGLYYRIINGAIVPVDEFGNRVIRASYKKIF